MKYRVLIPGLILSIGISMAGCHMRVAQVDKGTNGTKAEYSPLMYKERPVSIVVLPIVYASAERKMRPATERLFVEAISDTLRRNGYDVVPGTPDSVNEGPLDIENLPLQKYKDEYGADAVLYTVCKRWVRYFAVDGFQITGAMLLVLKSNKTGQVLWTQGIMVCKGDVGIAVDIVCRGGGGWEGLTCCLGLLAVNVGLVVVQHQTGLSRYVPNAKEISETIQLAFKSMPYGKFHEYYGKDMNDPLPYQHYEKEKEKDGRQLRKALEGVSNFFSDTLNKIKGQSKRLFF